MFCLLVACNVTSVKLLRNLGFCIYDRCGLLKNIGGGAQITQKIFCCCFDLSNVFPTVITDYLNSIEPQACHLPRNCLLTFAPSSNLITRQVIATSDIIKYLRNGGERGQSPQWVSKPIGSSVHKDTFK